MRRSAAWALGTAWALFLAALTVPLWALPVAWRIIRR